MDEQQTSQPSPMTDDNQRAGAPSPHEPSAPEPEPIVPPASVAPSVGGGGKPKGSGLSENVASALCYVLGLLTGIVFLLIDKRERVRFNAAQSIVVFGGLVLVNALLNGLGIRNLNGLIGLLSLILGIVLVYRSYKGNDLKLDFLSSIVDVILGKGKQDKGQDSDGGQGNV